MRSILSNLPGIPFIVRHLSSLLFPGSSRYWDRRYRWGGTSGAGSYGKLATFKADFVNDFVRDNGIDSVIDFGCGDGNQLKLAHYPSYIGLDVSENSIAMLSDYYKDDPTKSFFLMDAVRSRDGLDRLSADCAISMDVVYHLVEDAVFETYMNRLFRSARRFVIVYSSDYEGPPEGHVRHRRFSDFIDSNWKSFELVRHIPNDYPEHTFAEFFVYRKVDRDRSG